MDTDEAINLAKTLASTDELLSTAAKNENRKSGGVLAGAAPNYSLDGLNIKGRIPLQRIVEAARRFRSESERPDVDRPRFSLLLTGAPGSGKTAFVHHLSREIGATLVSKKVSDVMSMWIGESEKNIAKAFAEAKRKEAILFLDEVDSLLMSRECAMHEWEVQHVNELLQQMEEFDGILIGATNCGAKLDRAVMRRFTFKLEFGYLTNDGKEKLFRRYFKDRLTRSERRRLDAIDNLTPGDFRTVRESLFYVCEHETNADRLAALEDESAAKNIRRPLQIGF